MIRIIGAGCLAAGAVLLSTCAVRYLRQRVCDLAQLLRGLEVIRRELDYRLAPLPELLKEAAEQSEGRPALLFRLCANGAEHLNGRTFYTVWSQALEASQLSLEQADLSILNQLGGVLGRYDGENQRQALESVLEKLEEQHREARERKNKMGKVYGVLGLTTGAFILILLI